MKAKYYITNQPPKHRRATKVGEQFRVRLNRADRRVIRVNKGTITPCS